MADPKDVIVVQDNWKMASVDLIDLGVEIFSRFFANDVAHTMYFRRILSKGGCHVTNAYMRRLALQVTSTMGMWIHALTDITVVPGLLYIQGVKHKAMGVTPALFEEILPCIFASVERRIGPSFNKQAWKNVFTWIVQGVAEGMK